MVVLGSLPNLSLDLPYYVTINFYVFQSFMLYYGIPFRLVEKQGLKLMFLFVKFWLCDWESYLWHEVLALLGRWLDTISVFEMLDSL